MLMHSCVHCSKMVCYKPEGNWSVSPSFSPAVQQRGSLHIFVAGIGRLQSVICFWQELYFYLLGLLPLFFFLWTVLFCAAYLFTLSGDVGSWESPGVLGHDRV